MRVYSYLEGEYVPNHRGHYYICPLCKNEFFGQKGSRFCSPQHRWKFHNDKRAEIKKSALKDIDRITKTIRVLEELYNFSCGIKAIPFFRFLERGVDLKGPFRPIKSRIDGRVLYKVGNYAYYPDEKLEVVIYRLDETDQPIKPVATNYVFQANRYLPGL